MRKNDLHYLMATAAALTPIVFGLCCGLFGGMLAAAYLYGLIRASQQRTDVRRFIVRAYRANMRLIQSINL